MNLELKYGISEKRTLAIFSALAVLFGGVAIFVGDIFVPLCAAYLAALMLFDRTKQRICSVLISVSILVLNTLGIIFTDVVSLSGIMAVGGAVIITACFLSHRTKNECVLAVTVIFSLLIAAGFTFTLMKEAGEFSFTAAAELYDSLYTTVRSGFLSSIGDITSSLGDGTADVIISTEEIGAAFDTMANLVIAFTVIFAFILAGITFKALERVVSHNAKDSQCMIEWSFCPPALFGYFYLILFVVSFFMTEATVFSITVLNLYYVFTAVFIYPGFRLAVAFLSSARSAGFAYIMIFAALLIFPTFAVELLSLLGVFFAVNRGNRGDSRGE